MKKKQPEVDQVLTADNTGTLTIKGSINKSLGLKNAAKVFTMHQLLSRWWFQRFFFSFHPYPQGNDPNLTCRVLKGGCSRGGGNWGTLRIPFGKIGEP